MIFDYLCKSSCTIKEYILEGTIQDMLTSINPTFRLSIYYLFRLFITYSGCLSLTPSQPHQCEYILEILLTLCATFSTVDKADTMASVNAEISWALASSGGLSSRSFSRLERELLPDVTTFFVTCIKRWAKIYQGIWNSIQGLKLFRRKVAC